MARHSDAVVRRVPARVGLVGNPSDGYGGAVLGTVVPGLAATVTAEHCDGIELGGTASIDQWRSTSEWRQHVGDVAPIGDHRIINAALWTLDDHIRTRHGPRRRPDDGHGVRLTWTTDIPRSVGLAGSSALAVGVIEATAALWDVSLDPRVVAALALSAERDVLGIAAGWQDRIIQSFGGCVLVDAGSMATVDGLSVPTVSVLAPCAALGAPISFLVGWNEATATTSDGYHGPLRALASSLAVPMEGLAGLARQAARAMTAGDVDELARAVDDGWKVRQACAPLRADHADLVEQVRSTGLAATTPGSGGSVVTVCANEDRVVDAIAALKGAGCSWQRFGLPLPRM